MNKKILIFGVLAALMLVTITYASAVTQTQTTRKESPLFSIRTKIAIGERLQTIKETIKTKFLGERIFFIPLSIKTIINPRPSMTLFDTPTDSQMGCCPATTQDTCFFQDTCFAKCVNLEGN